MDWPQKGRGRKMTVQIIDKGVVIDGGAYYYIRGEKMFYTIGGWGRVFEGKTLVISVEEPESLVNTLANPIKQMLEPAPA